MDLTFILQGGKQSLGVRMALGETQVVAEIREFLMDNGVALDSFSQVSLGLIITYTLDQSISLYDQNCSWPLDVIIMPCCPEKIKFIRNGANCSLNQLQLTLKQYK